MNNEMEFWIYNTNTYISYMGTLTRPSKNCMLIFNIAFLNNNFLALHYDARQRSDPLPMYHARVGYYKLFIVEISYLLQEWDIISYLL